MTLFKPNKKDKKCKNETERSKSEEQFPKDTVGQLSANCRLVTDSQKWKPLFTITQKGSPQDFLHLCKVYVISRMTQFHGI